MKQENTNDKNNKTNQEIFKESYENVLDIDNENKEENPTDTKDTTPVLNEVLSMFEFSNPKLEVLENAKLLYRQFKMYYHKKDKHTRNLILSETERDLFYVIKNIAKANSVNLYSRPKTRRSFQEDAVQTLFAYSAMFGIYFGENAFSSHEFSVLSSMLGKTINSLRAWVISDFKRFLEYKK